MRVRRTKDHLARCEDCRADTGWDGLCEWYMVKDGVWEAAWPGSKKVITIGGRRDYLCIGCLEARLGRELNSGDFAPVPLNDPTSPHIPARMRGRLLAMAPFPAGAESVINCALIDDLIAKAQAGDPVAFARLRQVLKGYDASARARTYQRDESLRGLRDRLRSDHVGISDRALATLLAEAGRYCTSRRDKLPGDRAPFDCLTRPELAWLDSEIRALLVWVPSWPSVGQMRKFLMT
jgi:hypothetical protein